MSWDQVLALILAGYGAGLSTLLAVREIRKGRRRIAIFLDYLAFLERAQITITNVGYRLVTVTEIWMIPEGHDSVPSNALLTTEAFQKQPLPATLNDGEHITLPLSDGVSNALSDNGMKAVILVRDAEGREYSKHKVRHRNPKWSYFGSG